MNKKNLIPILAGIVLLAAALACETSAKDTPAAPTPEPATQVSASPTPQPTASPAPTQASGITVSYKGTSFSIADNTLATGAKTETIAKIDDQNGAPWDVAPEHLKFTLDGYQGDSQMGPPTIYVYPAADYEAVSNGAAINLQRLRAIISGAGMDINNNTVPFVPFYNATQTLLAQPMQIKFKTGSGIRTVTQYDQAPIPVNNKELIYHFQGLTADGQYYIIAIFPINAAMLVADGNPSSPVPPGGIAFNQSDPMSYFKAVTEKLDALSPDAFSPSLTTLDNLIASLNVTAP